MDCLSCGGCQSHAQRVQRDWVASPCVCALFLPALVGVGLGHVCGAAGGLCQSSTLLGLTLWPAAPPPVHVYFPSYLFLGEWLQVAVTTVALHASWDLPMDSLSYSGGCAWGGEVWVCIWHRGPCQSSSPLGPPPHPPTPCPGLWFLEGPVPLPAPTSQFKAGIDQRA
jgi:hypothetical protein